MVEPTARILITGGAGFIGSALVRHLIAHTGHEVLNVDKLTYAGNLASLEAVSGHPRYSFLRADIGDAAPMREALRTFKPDVVTHLAAESHVDRSIDGPADFIHTNVVGAFVLLDEVLGYWRSLEAARRDAFRFHHISTDEVFGSLPATGAFTELSPYAPRSPYAASKAASDHLVRAWGHTYGLPVIITNCSNNFGPYQFPEKLIPLIIIKALTGELLPIYGAGSNVRDWLHVEDHARALAQVFTEGAPGETYLIGARAERTNIEVVQAICRRLDQVRPRTDGSSHAARIAHVADRPGHDHRYAIDPAKLEVELGWSPQSDFETGLARTVDWYLANEAWWGPILANTYGGERLGSRASTKVATR